MKQNMWQRGGNPEHLFMRVPVDGAHSVAFRAPFVYEYRQPDIPTDEVIAEYAASNKAKYNARIVHTDESTGARDVTIDNFDCACCNRSFGGFDARIPSGYADGVCRHCWMYLHYQKNGDKDSYVEFGRYPTMEELTDIVEMGVLHKDVSMVFHVLKQHYEASK